MSRPERDRSERPSALTTPAVTVVWKPYGLPIAIDELAGTQPARFAERAAAGDVVGADAHDGEVGVGIVADQRRQRAWRPSASVTSMRDRVVHDVAVREHEAVGA